MATFYTSDLHLGHKNIIEYSGRPYADVEEMDQALADNWCSVVGADDTVIFLGDSHLGSWQRAAEILRSLPGKKILLPGNHDECWYGHKRHQRWVDRFREEAGFEVILNVRQSYDVVCTSDGSWFPVTLAHFPYLNESHYDDRYADERPIDHGRWLLHGHVHEAWKIRPGERMINVGVDVWDYTPVRAEVLADLIVEHSR